MIFQDRTYLREKPDAFPSVSSSEIGSVNQFPPEKPRRHLQVPVNRTFICGRMSRPYGAVSQSVASLSGGSEYWPLNEKSQQKRCHLALYPVRRTETKAMHFIRQQVSRQRCFFCSLFGQYPDALRCTGRQRVACGRPVRSTCKNLRRIYRLNQAFNA